MNRAIDCNINVKGLPENEEQPMKGRSKHRRNSGGVKQIQNNLRNENITSDGANDLTTNPGRPADIRRVRRASVFYRTCNQVTFVYKIALNTNLFVFIINILLQQDNIYSSSFHL